MSDLDTGRSSTVRYARIQDTSKVIVGIEVDGGGDDVVHPGTNAQGRAYHGRMRVIQRGAIKKIVEMRMNCQLERAQMTSDESDPDRDRLSTEYNRLLAIQAQAIRELDREDGDGEARRLKLEEIRIACLATEAARIRLIRR
jgi:hypothetical protein